MTTSLTYVGHATVLIEAGGTRLLTDPVLRPRIAHLRRLVALPDLEALVALDAVLLTHAHYDHLDLPSLKLVARACPVVAPRGCGPLLRRRGYDVTELEPGDSVRIGSLDIAAMLAEHDGRRHPAATGETTLCYVVEGPERVFFAGDTDLFEAMSDLAGKLDVALLPISGWGPRVPAGHLNPERAALATARMRPRIVVPVHWGTLASPGVYRHGEDPAAPTHEFAALVARHAPGVDVRVLPPGERLVLGEG